MAASDNLQPRQFFAGDIDPRRLTWTANVDTGTDIPELSRTIQSSGYDRSHPIGVRYENSTAYVINGHHRAKASIMAGEGRIPAVMKVRGDEMPDLQNAYPISENAYDIGTRGEDWGRLLSEEDRNSAQNELKRLRNG